MNSFQLEHQQKVDNRAILSDFISSNPDSRELKRALAVKMALEGEPYFKITKFLGINKSFITYWKNRFEAQGIEGIKLGYQGSKSYLTPDDRTEIISWLRTRNYWNFDELVSYLDEHYDVIYKSKQSYYTLFSEAGISWKKSQKTNPKSDPALVKKKREEIQGFIRQNQFKIESGELIVLFLDECHLLWGDVCGYVWGKTDMRIEIPITNERIRQTYYGALNYQTKEFILHPYEKGNGENTVAFMKYLQEQNPGKQIALIWDGASYHKSQEIKDFLATVNHGKEETEWQFKCILFAPNSPEQNPVEDVWLQAKNSLRRFWRLCRSFPAVKYLFEFFIDHQKFDFSKIEEYSPCS
ncbi:IS630 family transposase [Halomicronema hongdechloris]|uniref:IS630 family transposase n=1 Tax=Halomicronema hongdechloris TaxID=1209493 RepID=UPI000B4CE243